MAVGRVFSYVCTVAFLAVGLRFLTVFSSYHVGLYSANWRPAIAGHFAPFVFSTPDLLTVLFWCYALVLLPSCWRGSGQPGRAAIVSLYIWRVISGRVLVAPSSVELQALLVMLLKFFFVPFILNGAIGHLAGLNNMLLSLSGSISSGAGWVAWFDRLLDPLLINIVFLFDLAPFVVGYMTDGRLLKNQIVSVDSSLLGWVACLSCYPPFNASVGDFLNFGGGEFFSAFADTFPVLHVAVNVLILAVFALYASASVSLGWKSSNLTNRGVVACGLYRFVRHPAYVCKNAAWWLSASPALFGAFQTSFTFGCWCLFSLSCWTAIYALRAITEERHLLRVDTGYAAYRQAVPYRFIPFIL